MDCLDCGTDLQWQDTTKVYRDREWIEAGYISESSGNRNMYQPAAIYLCPSCENEYEVKFFTFKNEPGNAMNGEQVPQMAQEKGILCMGWGGSPLKSAESPPSNEIEAAGAFDEYFDGSIRSDNRDFVIWMEPGDIVFTYDHYREGKKYFMTRVTGGFESPHDPDARLYGSPLDEETREMLLRQDVSQYREVEWKEISVKELPGALNNDVPIQQGTIRKIKTNFSAHVARNAVRLWDDMLTSTDDMETLENKVKSTPPEILANCLNETELEEAVSALLQRKEDAIMQLNTSGSTQPNVEAILRTQRDGDPHVIYFQVKSNSHPDNLGDLGKAKDESLYIYAGGDIGSFDHAEYLTDKDLKTYIKQHLTELPPDIRSTLNRQL